MTRSSRALGKSLRTPLLEDFCRLMISARKNAGLTQQELADRLGRPQSFVAKYEGGERRIDVVEFIRIAETLEADPVRLIEKLLSET